MTTEDQHRFGDSTSSTKRAVQAVGLGALMAVAVAVPAAERAVSVVETVQLGAAASRTWGAVRDFGAWQSWHPAFASTRMLQGDGHSKGSVRVLMTHPMTTAQMKEGTSKPKPRIVFEEGESVRVVSGPFANFPGFVDQVHPDKEKVRVMVQVFGRATPVMLDYVAVEKA